MRCRGALADTEGHGLRVAFNRVFARFGLKWSWSEDLNGELLAIQLAASGCVTMSIHFITPFLKISGGVNLEGPVHCSVERAGVLESM
ncbi:MAG: hypothetical protein QGG61_04190 [Arenicellales bacterium]|nr:hypothetical protein [Arenicellales bacterium]